MNYYERHIGDYLKDTAHLSLLEHGVYTRLLDVYYTREGGIPVTECARLVGAKSKDERAALGVVLAEFFVVEAEILKQGRCDIEIARFHDKQRKAKASADARWSHTERNANAMRTHSEGNAPSLQTPEEISEPTVPPSPTSSSRLSKFPPGFEPFWAAYPRKVGKDAAIKAFARRRFTEPQRRAVLAAIEAQKTWEAWTKDGGQFIPHPATWLNEGRWQDEAPGAASADRFAAGAH